MIHPVRVRLSRAKGWRMPPNTVSVARPTKWGNPWRLSDYREAGYIASDEQALERCVSAYRAWITGAPHWAVDGFPIVPPDPAELRGKNLACWCPLVDEHGHRVPCHADVLLELANRD